MCTRVCVCARIPAGTGLVERILDLPASTYTPTTILHLLAAVCPESIDSTGPPLRILKSGVPGAGVLVCDEPFRQRARLVIVCVCRNVGPEETRQDSAESGVLFTDVGYRQEEDSANVRV